MPVLVMDDVDFRHRNIHGAFPAKMRGFSRRRNAPVSAMRPRTGSGQLSGQFSVPACQQNAPAFCTHPHGIKIAYSNRQLAAMVQQFSYVAMSHIHDALQ